MAAITLDASLRAKLNGFNETLDVRDESGATVGHFLPAKTYLELLYAWERSRPLDAAACEQARADHRNGQTMTTAEAVAYLERCAKQGKTP